MIVRDLARRPSNWRATDDLDGFLRPPRGLGHRRHRHAPAHAPHPPRRRDPGRVRHRRPRHAARGRAGRRRYRRPRSRVGRHDARAVHRRSRRRDPLRRRVRLRDQAFDPRPTRRRGLPGRGRARGHERRRRARARARRRVPLERSRRPGRGHRGARRACRSCSATCPVFGICLGHQIMSLALGAETFKLRFGHHGGNHPVRHLPTGRVEITSQNHNYAVDATSLARRAAWCRT